jgi:hypothetical protein
MHGKDGELVVAFSMKKKYATILEFIFIGSRSGKLGNELEPVLRTLQCGTTTDRKRRVADMVRIGLGLIGAIVCGDGAQAIQAD